MAKHNSTTKPKAKAKVIPAVAYCRKSTNEEGAAKSIADQKARIRDLTPPDTNAEYEVKTWYTLDLGVPGWKRGAARPDYHKLVEDLKQTKAKAILVDDMDRFSRADEWQTVADVLQLKEKGVKYIHAVNQGCRDLGQEGAVHIIAAQANASHEHCTRLSRRISEARKDRAKEGKVSGGKAPFGMAYVGCKDNWKLKPGDPAEAETVRSIFDAFVNKRQSLNSIAGDLNCRKVKPPRGKSWYAASIKVILERRAYRGTFNYGDNATGQFHRLDGGKIIKVSPYDEPEERTKGEAPFLKENAWQPLVDPALWDKAQKRIKSFDGGKRKPRGVYPLSGFIRCDHCGNLMYPTTTDSGKVFYRCKTADRVGYGCKNYGIKQDDILPFVLQLLGEEIDRVLTLPEPTQPDALRPKAGRDKAEVEKQIAKLRLKIDRAEDNLLEATDARSRQNMDAKIKAMWAEVDALESELQVDESEAAEQADQLRQLAEWWAEAKGQLYAVPYAVEDLPDELADTKAFIGAFDGPTAHKHVDAGALQEVLTALGAEIRLRWKTHQVTLSNGKTQNRYEFTRGRFRLGQKSGLIRSLLSTTTCRSLQKVTLPILAQVDRTFSADALVRRVA